MSVLFLDLVGSTARGDGADPEDVSEFLATFFEPVREEVRRHGGTIEKFIGDAVVAIFGAPVAHGDDAERAVRCALRLQEVVRDLNAADGTLRLAARVGVATGEAVISLGSGFRSGESLATGDVLNVAARLQAGAPVGGVAVSAATRRAAQRSIEFESLPSIEAKGKSEALEAWVAIGPRETALAFQRGTPLAGRQAELMLLEGHFQRVREGAGNQLVTLLGEPGVGKSRLAAEFAQRVEAAGARVLRGRSLPFAEESGYDASAGQVAQLAGIRRDDPPEAARARLRAAAEAEVGREEAADVARYLSLLLGLGLDLPAAARQLIFYAVRRLVEGVCSRQPLLLLFDDLHWAGESQLDLVEFLAGATAERPVLLLLVARPELAASRPTLAGERGLRIDLPPLPATDAEALVRSLLPAGVEVASLLEAADGNPLFLEELAGARAPGESRPQSLPATIREAVSARIDILPALERAVLLDAAVFGRVCWHGGLAALDPGRSLESLDAALAGLTARDLLRAAPRSRLGSDREFEIKHVLVEEVAYQTLPRESRRLRHSRCASFLEAALPDPGAMAGALALHWKRAGEPGRAIDHLLVAAERACAAMAAGEARAFFGEAAELAAASDPARLLPVRALRGRRLVDLTDFTAALDDLRWALPQLEGRERVEALLAAARAAYWLEDVADALAFAGGALEAAEALADRELTAVALGLGSSFRDLNGDLQAATRLGERALSLWPPGHRQADLAAFNENLADVRYWLGDYGESERLAQKAYELAGEAHSIEPLLRGGGWRGLSLAAQGRTEEALAWLDSIFARAQELDHRWGAATLNYSSLPLRDLQLFSEARARNEHALEIVRTRGAWGMPEMQAEIDILLADLALGEYGRVAAALPRIWEAAINGKAWRPWLGGCRLALVRARLAAATSTSEEAAWLAQDAIDRAARVGRVKYVAQAQLVLGEALVGMGRAPEGLAALRAAAATADRLGQPSDRWQAWGALSRQLARTGDESAAEAARGVARNVIDEYARGLSADHARTFRAADPVAAILGRSSA